MKQGHGAIRGKVSEDPAKKSSRRRRQVLPSPPVMVELPLPVEESKGHQPAQESGGKSVRILIVEDHGDTVRAMARLLEGEGHRVCVARTVRQALDLIARTPLDLLICDIGLPDGSGHEIPLRMKPPQPLVAIALSAHVTDEDYERSRQCGFRAHIPKPVEFHRLCELIQTLVI